MSVKLDINIANYKPMLEKLNSIPKTSEYVLEKTLTEFKTRGASWVSKGVREVYGIRASDMEKPWIKGSGFSMELSYKSGMHSLRSFGMKPTNPNYKNGYTVSSAVIKGKRVKFEPVKKPTKKRKKGVRTSKESPIMALPINGNILPFQRVSEKRNDLKIIKALSTPQMVGAEKVQPAISKNVYEQVFKRMEHNLERYLNAEK